MATSIGKTACTTCQKEKFTYKCLGCSQEFCYDDLGEHRQQISRLFDELDYERNIFRQTLNEQIKNPQNHSLIQLINKWENDSINKIQQTADEAKQLILVHAIEYFREIEIKLKKLTKELKQIRSDSDFNEINLNQLKQKLKQLNEQLDKPSTISIRQKDSSFIKKIFVSISFDIPINAKWIQNGTTVAGGNGASNGLNQLYYPWNVYIGDDETVYVADYSNHRIVAWISDTKNGQVVAGGNGAGNQNNLLNSPTNVIIDKENDSLIICDYGNQRVIRWPRGNGKSGETIISNVDCWGLAMDNDGYLYVSDCSKHEVRRWKIGDKDGTIVAGGNGGGNGLNQLNHPQYIFVDQDYSVYVSEYNNHRVTKWMKNATKGIVVAGGQGAGNGLTQLSGPRGVIVDRLGTVYVADHNNHRVMRWFKGATEGSLVVGGNGQGGQVSQFNNPFGLSFDRQNNLYVVDYNNHRVQKFNIDSL